MRYGTGRYMSSYSPLYSRISYLVHMGNLSRFVSGDFSRVLCGVAAVKERMREREDIYISIDGERMRRLIIMGNMGNIPRYLFIRVGCGD